MSELTPTAIEDDVVLYDRILDAATAHLYARDPFRRSPEWWAGEIRRVAAADRKAQRAEAVREAGVEMRKAWSGHWNLPDPRDPTISYSPDRWLEVRADRIEASDVE